MAFAKRRQARVIRTQDDDEDENPQMNSSPAAASSNSTSSRMHSPFHSYTSNDLWNYSLYSTLASTTTFAVSKSKPFKESSLRQSIAASDHDDTTSNDGSATSKPAIRQVDFGPPKFKKRRPAKIASRLSFGPGEIISGDAAEALDDELFTPKKSGVRRKVVPSSLRISLDGRNGWEGPQVPKEELVERPRYSRDYLQELKGSTPSTPKEMQGAPTPESEKGLDASELEGALIVGTEDTGRAYIPTEAEIAEKKERRHRLAQEQDFISLDSGPDRKSVV